MDVIGAGNPDSGRIREAGTRKILGLVVVALGLPGFLAACALPPALSIASFAVDGLSYAATKKSVQDHALSAAVGEDCALWRVVAGTAICKPNKDDSVAAEVAVSDDAATTVPQAEAAEDIKLAQLSVPPLTPLGTAVGPVASDAAPTIPARTVMAPTSVPAAAPAAPVIAVETLAPKAAPGVASAPAPPIRASSIPAASNPVTSGVYVVLASYGDAPRAEVAARQHRQMGARVVEGVAAGRTVHRVVAGPFAPHEAADMRRAARQAGTSEAWLLPL
jgi:hypothetical protein